MPKEQSGKVGKTTSASKKGKCQPKKPGLLTNQETTTTSQKSLTEQLREVVGKTLQL